MHAEAAPIPRSFLAYVVSFVHGKTLGKPAGHPLRGWSPMILINIQARGRQVIEAKVLIHELWVARLWAKCIAAISLGCHCQSHRVQKYRFKDALAIVSSRIARLAAKGQAAVGTCESHCRGPRVRLPADANPHEK